MHEVWTCAFTTLELAPLCAVRGTMVEGQAEPPGGMQALSPLCAFPISSWSQVSAHHIGLRRFEKESLESPSSRTVAGKAGVSVKLDALARLANTGS